MDGWTDAANGCIRALLIHCETLRDVLLFFSLKALLLGKALAQIFSILWPSLLIVHSTGAHVQSPNKPKQTTDKAQQCTKQHKQTSPYCHNLSHHVTCIRIDQDLSGSAINDTTTNMIKTKEQRGHTNNNSTKYQTTAPLHLSVSTPLYFYPAFLQLPLSLTKLHRQKVPTFAIWIPTPPVFAFLSASIARNLRLLPLLLQLLVRYLP